METLWFALVGLMLGLYVVFDGFDLGVGILHLAVGRTGQERRLLLGSIGPVWDGNEVWLLAAAGVLYFAFPVLYARSFSGFYLPLMIVLWLLILRGIALEFRGHVEGPVWAPFWDAVFSVSSALLAFVYGAALGNVVRGVPLDETGRFFCPLWTGFLPGRDAGILDAYTVTVGLAAAAALAHHGALWLVLKAPGALEERARAAARSAWRAALVLTAVLTLFTLGIQPLVFRNLAERPWGSVFPAAAVAGLLLARALSRRRSDLGAFLASSAYLAGMMASAAFGVYPYVLPAVGEPERGLSAAAAAAGAYGLGVGLAWWIPGMLLVTLYFWIVYRRLAGKVSLDAEGYGR